MATPEDMLAAAGPRLQFPTSVCFAGDDLRTVYADRPSRLTRPGRESERWAVAASPVSPRGRLAVVVAGQGRTVLYTELSCDGA